jgi:hypothetical protein
MFGIVDVALLYCRFYGGCFIAPLPLSELLLYCSSCCIVVAVAAAAVLIDVAAAFVIDVAAARPLSFLFDNLTKFIWVKNYTKTYKKRQIISTTRENTSIYARRSYGKHPRRMGKKSAKQYQSVT